MRMIIALLLIVCLCSGCGYMSSNVIKLRGDEIKGHIATTPVNIEGKNMVITIYREMIMTWKNLTPKFSKTVHIENDGEKGGILLEK